VSVRQALRSWSFWVLVLIFAAQTFGTGALNVHLIPYLESDDVGFSRGQAASVLGFYTVLSVFGRLGGGWAADQFGGRTVMAALLALQAAGFLILANLSAYWLVIPYAALYGTAFGGLMTARGVIVSSFFGRDSFGGIWGLIGSGTVVTGVVAPVFMGWVFDMTGSYRLALYTIIAVTALGIPLTFLARPPRVERQGPTPAGAVPV
jgi:MFS family permease